MANQWIYEFGNAAPNTANDWTKRELLTVENGAELAAVEVALDLPEGGSIETPVVQEGSTCAVRFRDYDNVGNFTDSAEFPFTVDDTEPPAVPGAPTFIGRREI